MSDPKEFSCMDDHDNDGWGKSTIEREQRFPDTEEEPEDIPEDEEGGFGEEDFD